MAFKESKLSGLIEPILVSSIPPSEEYLKEFADAFFITVSWEGPTAMKYLCHFSLQEREKIESLLLRGGISDIFYILDTHHSVSGVQ